MSRLNNFTKPSNLAVIVIAAMTIMIAIHGFYMGFNGVFPTGNTNDGVLLSVYYAFALLSSWVVGGLSLVAAIVLIIKGVSALLEKADKEWEDANNY